MKGLKILRAKPSNAIDIFPLLAKAAEEGVFDVKPSQKELKMYYFKKMVDELAHPAHAWYVAQRGRGFLGFIHGIVIPSRWDGDKVDTVVIDAIYVAEKYRKQGIGKKLIEELKHDADNFGIKHVLFTSPESLDQKWIKDMKAEKIKSLMRVDL